MITQSCDTCKHEQRYRAEAPCDECVEMGNGQCSAWELPDTLPPIDDTERRRLERAVINKVRTVHRCGYGNIFALGALYRAMRNLTAFEAEHGEG